MPKPINKSYTLAAASQSRFANDATGATITLANTATSDGQAYKIAILNNGGNDLSSINFTLVGTDADGRAQTEVLVGPTGSATVYSVYYYKTLTSVTLSSTLGANTVDIGTTTQFSTPTIPCDYGSVGSALSVDFANTVTMNYTMQATFDNIQTKNPPFYWQAVGSPFTAATAPQNSYNPQSPRAYRVTTASYSGTPTFQFSILQNQNQGG